MYPARAARELGILLRISRELDVVGDVTAVTDNPSELLAWATTLTAPALSAWTAPDSGARFLEVSADHDHEPIRGRVTAVLPCDEHPEFWHELVDNRQLVAGVRSPLTLADVTRAWESMPITPPT